MRSAKVDGAAVKRARELAGFTQDQLAARLGVQRTAVALWESGRFQPNAANFSGLCHTLNVREADLLAVDDDKAA